MNIFRIFHIRNRAVLAHNCWVKGVVTKVSVSLLHVVKKPVRLYPNERNTMYSHYIHFTYSVNGIDYTGILYVDLRYRCPQPGEEIEVYYDPEKPKNYACYSFGPNTNPIGW